MLVTKVTVTLREISQKKSCISPYIYIHIYVKNILTDYKNIKIYLIVSKCRKKSYILKYLSSIKFKISNFILNFITLKVHTNFISQMRSNNS